MTPLTIYLVLAAALFAFLCFVWSSRSGVNVALKLALFAMAVASVVFAGMEAGLIVTLPK